MAIKRKEVDRRGVLFPFVIDHVSLDRGKPIPTYALWRGVSQAERIRMSLFTVTMQSPKPALVAALKQHVEDHYEVHDRLIVVRYAKSAKQLFDILTIPDHEKSGFVIAQISADYYGFASKAFWDWLATSFRADVDG